MNLPQGDRPDCRGLGAGHHPAPGWHPPCPPKAHQHREQMSQGRQGPRVAPCAEEQKETSTDATLRRHGAWNLQSWEKQRYPSSTDKEIGSQSLGADQEKSATGHKTGPYSPLL